MPENRVAVRETGYQPALPEHRPGTARRMLRRRGRKDMFVKLHFWWNRLPCAHGDVGSGSSAPRSTPQRKDVIQHLACLIGSNLHKAPGAVVAGLRQVVSIRNSQMYQARRVMSFGLGALGKSFRGSLQSGCDTLLQTYCSVEAQI